MNKFAFAVLAASAAITAALPAQAQYAQPSGNPLSSIFSCQNPGNRQGTGAVLGAVVGGLAGNQIADNDRRSGTVIGALVGAAAGSMIGCKMQTQDQQRAQMVTQQALATGQSQTWTNPQTGASGRVDVINTYNYGGPGGGNNNAGYNNNQGGGYNARPTLNSVRFNQGIEQPREYQQSEGTYSAGNNSVVRSGPSLRARQVDSLRQGDTFDGLVRVEGTDWVLAARDGQAIGYVQESTTRFLGENYNQGNNGRGGNGRGNNNSGGYTNVGGPGQPYQQGRGQMCRIFNQTFTFANGQTEQQQYNACQTATGEWVIQS